MIFLYMLPTFFSCTCCPHYFPVHVGHIIFLYMLPTLSSCTCCPHYFPVHVSHIFLYILPTLFSCTCCPHYFPVHVAHIIFLYMLPTLFHVLNSSGATGGSAFSFLTSTSSLITAAGNYKVKTLGGFQWRDIRTNFPKKSTCNLTR
jgi:hypothetical protein